MAVIRIKSPIEDHTGTCTIGSTVLAFSKGTATYEGTLPVGVERYLKVRGYKVGKAATPVSEDLIGVGEKTGAPSTEWSHDKIDAYAAEHKVSLTGANTKPEKIAVLEKAAAQTEGGGGSGDAA